MISIVYSTHKDSEYNKKFQKHLSDTIGIENFEILEYQNNNEYSLSQIYNKGISESIFNIVVCCHNDIKLEKGWGKKLIKDFEENPEFGIIGKAGSCYFPESGVYWERMTQTMVGQVYHHPEGEKKWLSLYSPKVPFLIPVVTIDGLFISFDKTKIKHQFDESIGRFHFYDHLFCLPNFLDGVKIGVTSSFEITHQSVGRPNQEFWDSRIKFLEKFKEKLPLDLKPNKIYVPEYKDFNNKSKSRVAVIILNKNKSELLINCINSFIQNCRNDNYTFFVADTGSEKEEKEKILDFIKNKKNINFIEFSYYNFAKINNEVVKNYIDESYDFLLFCNNDVLIKNNILDGMISVFKNYPNAGTVGCRLHFEDNTVQHDGVVAFFDKEKKFRVTHNNLGSYYKYKLGVKKVIGNTAALMMIRKKTFEKLGFFNESYNTCFEDVELNFKSLLNGYENYNNGDLVAYHFESQTRGKDEKNQLGESEDFINNLTPFIKQNFQKLNLKFNNFFIQYENRG